MTRRRSVRMDLFLSSSTVNYTSQVGSDNSPKNLRRPYLKCNTLNYGPLAVVIVYTIRLTTWAG